MKHPLLFACLLSLPLAAQDDVVHLANGTNLTGLKVTNYDVRELRYTKGGTPGSTPTDQVVKVELAQFKDVFRLGLRDPDLMVTKAREQLAEKKPLLAQLGMLSAATQLFDAGRAGDAVGVLDELQKALPEAGVMPDAYRLKFEYYMGQGQKGAQSANTVAKKYLSDVQGAAWAAGLGVEAEFFVAMAERAAGGQPKDFQLKLRTVASKAGGNNAMIANRANIQLANSLRETKDLDGARRIYEDIVKKEGIDPSSRAGALLGLGLLTMDAAAGSDKEEYRKALLMFLRVRLETKDAWPSLHAEALYYAMLAAEKWRGNDFQFIMSRCRNLLVAEFGDSDWAQRARAAR
jgi:hypothetical protein